MVDQIQKLKTLFLSPSSFFQTVVKESKYSPILFYFVIIYIIGEVIRLIAGIPITLKVPDRALSIFMSIGGLIFSVGFAFAIPFIGAGINHLGVMIVGGKNKFFNTFKPSTYAMVISVVYGVAAAVLYLILDFINPIDYAALEAGTMTWQNIPFFNIVVMIIIAVVSFIHVLYAEVVGISKFQNMSKGKALLAVLIIPLILFVVIFGLGLIGAIAYFGILDPGNLIPERCTIEPGFKCISHQTNTDGKTQIQIKNVIGQDLKSVTVALENECTPTLVEWKNGDVLSFNCIGKSGKKGELHKQPILLTYTTFRTGLTKNVEGDLYSKYK